MQSRQLLRPQQQQYNPYSNTYTNFGEFNPTSTNLFNAANVIWKFILHGQYQIVYFMVIYLYNYKSYNNLRNTRTNPYYG